MEMSLLLYGATQNVQCHSIYRQANEMLVLITSASCEATTFRFSHTEGVDEGEGSDKK